MNRFDAFNPEEREILRVLLTNHVNTVSEISVAVEVRTSEYTLLIERLEREATGNS